MGVELTVATTTITTTSITGSVISIPSCSCRTIGITGQSDASGKGGERKKSKQWNGKFGVVCNRTYMLAIRQGNEKD